MMSRNVVADLVVRLSADASRLKNELSRTEQDAKRGGEAIGRSFQAAARNVTVFTAAAGAGFAAVIGTLTTAANKAAAFADEIDKAALRTRLSRGAVQELRFVTDQLGGSFATIETAVRGLTQRLAGVEQGSERQVEAFKRLGVATRDAGGQLRSTEELLFDSISALQGVRNETERAVLAQEVFGRSAQELGPLLSAGAGSIDELRQKARDLGIVLDDQSVRSLVQYKDQMSALSQQFGAVGREITLQFLPVLTEGVLPAVENTLRVFRSMPEPLQRGTAALSGFGAAASAAALALRGLGVPLTFLFGPAGLALGAVAVIGTLAFALAGRGKNELAGAVEVARGALASGDKDSLVGALDNVIAKVDGETRASLQRLRDDLVDTAEIGVEAAQAIADAFAEAALAPLRAERAALQTEIEQVERLLAANQDTRVAQARRDDIIREFTPVLDAGGLIPLAVQRELQELDAVLDGAGASAAFLARQEGLLAVRRERAAELDRQIAAGAAASINVVVPFAGGAGGGGGGGGGNAATAAAGVARTAQSVFDELAAGGAASQRYAAALGNTPEALFRSLTERRGLVENALRELTRDFADAVTDSQLSYLARRREELSAEIAEAERGVDPAAPSDLVDIPSVNLFGPTLTANENIARAQAEKAAQTQAFADRRYLATLSRNANTYLAFQDGRAAETEAFYEQAAREADLANRRYLSTERRNANAYVRYLEARGRAGQAQLAQIESVLAFEAQVDAAAAADSRRLAFRDRGVVGRGVRAGEVAAEEAANRLAQSQSRLGEGTNALASGFATLEDALYALVVAAQATVVAAPARRGSVGRGLFPNAPVPIVDPFGDAGQRGRGVGVVVPGKLAGDKIERLVAVEEAGESFRNSVILAAANFTDSLVQAIRAGDVGAAFRAALGAGGSVLGALSQFGPAAGLIGSAAAGPLGLIGALLPILGGIFGGLFGPRPEQVASRAAGAAPRGAPALELNFTFNQSLAVASLTDSESRAAMRRSAGEAFEQFQRVVQANVLPRLERLEARA